MINRSLDLETPRFTASIPSPPPVCAQWADVGGVAHLAATADIANDVRPSLQDPNVRLWGVHIAYDMGVLAKWVPGFAPLIKAKYEADQICDNGALEKVAWIGRYSSVQRYSLESMCDYYRVPHADKKGEERTDYGRFLGKPLTEYPVKHLHYMALDAIGGAKLTERQLERHVETNRVRLADVADLSRGLFWLARVADNGLRTDPAYIADLAEATTQELARLRDIAQAPFALNEQEEQAIAIAESILAEPAPAKLTKDQKARIKLAADTLESLRLVKLKTSKRKSGAHLPKKNPERVKRLVWEAYQGRPPMTKPAKKRRTSTPFVPQIQTTKACLEQSGHPLLELFAKYGVWSAVENKDLPMLAGGAIHPIHTRFNLADTTRSTSSRPNVQNQRSNALQLFEADGKTVRAEFEIRKAFIPREGFCFLNADYAGLENMTLAQVCVDLGIGHHLADLLNSGISLHDVVGAEIHGVSLEEAIRLTEIGDKHWKHGSRQAAKITNFGAPVGMGAAALKLNAKIAHNVDMTLAQATRYLVAWRRANPDGAAFLRHCSSLPKDSWGHTVRVPGTTITRRGAPFSAAANTYFQGLAAKLTRAVGWQVYWATQDRRSALWGSKLVNFIHDEFMLETPIGLQHDAGLELARLMVDHGKPFVPYMKLSAEVTASSRWTKEAKTLFGLDGRLEIFQA